jgi:hypothetical protein
MLSVSRTHHDAVARISDAIKLAFCKATLLA